MLASLGGNPGMVAAIDPSTRKILSEHDLGGATLYSEPAGKELVALVAPTDRIGPARLVVFDGSELREVTLTDVPAGLGAARRHGRAATTGRASRCPGSPSTRRASGRS